MNLTRAGLLASLISGWVIGFFISAVPGAAHPREGIPSVSQNPSGALYKIVRPEKGPSFLLTNRDGRTIRFSDLKGRVVVLTFFYATCPDTCPLFTAKLRLLRDRLGALFARDVSFVSITLDPEVDDLAALNAYARRFGAEDDGWWFLTGSVLQIKQIARAYGIWSQKENTSGTVDHTSSAFLIDREGYIRVKYVGRVLDPDIIVQHIRVLLAAGRER